MGHVLDEVKAAHLSTSQINTLINEWVMSARDRKILRAKLINGQTYEAIAEELCPQMSPRQVKRIVQRCVDDNLKPHF